MPFTFSHPAIVLPLAFIDDYRFSVTALTIGSITPDFEYFFRFAPNSVYSHTWLGIFWFDLPVAMVLFYLYNMIVKNELIDNLPEFLNSRFSRFKKMKKRKIYSTQKSLIIFTSLLIGITSHLFWDKLMHKSAGLIEEPIELYTFFWDANSVIGAAVIAFIIWRMPKGNVIKQDKFLFWFITLFIVLTIVIIRSAYFTEVRTMGVSAISGLFIGLLISSLIKKLLPRGDN